MNRKRAAVAIAIIAVAGVAFLHEVPTPPTLGSEEYDRSIMLQNDREQNVTVTVTIKQQSSDIYQETLTVTAHSKVEVAKLSANPLHVGRQYVNATVTDPEGGSTSLQLSINNCLGPAYFNYEPDGKLTGTPYKVVC